MEKYKIEEISAKDRKKIEELKEIEKEAFGDGAIDEWVLIPIARYGKIYGLSIEDELVSVVEMLKVWGKNEVYIYSFATKNKFQYQGYGKKLLEDIIRLIKEEQISNILLTVDPKNKEAISFYKKYGFVEEEYVKDEYGKNLDRIKMKLKLK